MKVLFIGGTGVISSACSELCIERGIELFLLNRGISPNINPEGSKVLKGDIRDTNQVKQLLQGHSFDTVVDWISYTPNHISNDFELFKSSTSQFVFISSASAYRKPPQHLPVVETDKLINPFWKYSQEKIDCENKLMELYKTYHFPVTIVRPSHTYNKTKIPLHGGYTALDRMLRGKKIIIHGDGTSLWTLTHQKDFAKGFIGLLGKPETLGEAYHITSDELLTWNDICNIFGNFLGVEPNIIHIPSDFIRHFDKEWGDGLLGDKAHCGIFDNTKIKKINPEFHAQISFKEGAKEIVSWYMADESRKQVDLVLDRKMDEIISRYESALI